MAIKYQLAEDGKSILIGTKGHPMVFDDEDANVTPYELDAIHLKSKIPALNDEAKNHRLEAEKYKKLLTTYEGIEDPKMALEALETIKQLESGDLKKKDELEKIKKEIEDAWKGKFDAATAQAIKDLEGKDAVINGLNTDLRTEMISSQFSKSTFFSGKEPITKLNPDFAEAYFGKNFKVEANGNGDGRKIVVGYVGEHPIMSKERPGEFAEFDEALTQIIDVYPMKDQILFKSEGSGGKGGSGGHLGKTSVPAGDNDSFINNLDAIAEGKVSVQR